MRRIVLDTNVFLDCWVFDDAPARPLRAALESGRALAVRSAATDAELANVVARPQFGLDRAVRSSLLDQWRRHATLIDVDVLAPTRCTDLADQMFLDLAFAARAVALFTKDKALLATASPARKHDLHVLAPAAAGSVLLFEDRLP